MNWSMKQKKNDSQLGLKIPWHARGTQEHRDVVCVWTEDLRVCNTISRGDKENWGIASPRGSS